MNKINMSEFTNVLEGTELLSCLNLPDFEDCTSEEKLKEAIKEVINKETIVYYGSAIEYLKKNDVSLSESLGLAAECGFTCDTLNSEILATLLYQQILKEELEELDFSECFEDYASVEELKDYLKFYLTLK